MHNIITEVKEWVELEIEAAGPKQQSETRLPSPNGVGLFLRPARPCAKCGEFGHLAFECAESEDMLER